MSAGDFWSFSVNLYARPGVAPACLELQDRHGLDVNLVLFCLWHGIRHGVMDARLCAAAVGFAGQWGGHVVGPLRAARRWMKGRQVPDLVEAALRDGLREKIKALELESERLQQQQLQAMAAGFAAQPAHSPTQAALANLDCYLLALGKTQTPDIRGLVDVIMGQWQAPAV